MITKGVLLKLKVLNVMYYMEVKNGYSKYYIGSICAVPF